MPYRELVTWHFDIRLALHITVTGLGSHNHIFTFSDRHAIRVTAIINRCSDFTKRKKTLILPGKHVQESLNDGTVEMLPGFRTNVFDGPLDGENQLVDITEFLKIRIPPGVDGLNGRPLRSVASQQDVLGAGGFCFNPAQQLQNRVCLPNGG